MTATILKSSSSSTGRCTDVDAQSSLDVLDGVGGAPALDTRMFSTIDPRFAIRSAYVRNLRQARPIKRMTSITKADTTVATNTKNRLSITSGALGLAKISLVGGQFRTTKPLMIHSQTTAPTTHDDKRAHLGASSRFTHFGLRRAIRFSVLSSAIPP